MRSQTGKVRVQLGGFSGTVVTSTSDFTFIAPSITSFSPTTGRSGEVITITGTGFSAVVGDHRVSFGGTSFEFSRAEPAFEVNTSGTEIKVRVPGTAQTGKVRVQLGTFSGPVSTSTADFTAIGYSQVSITGFSPTTARIGAVITITGTAFNAVAGGNYVHFGSQFDEGAATLGGSSHITSAYEVNSDGTELKVRVPTHARSGKIAILLYGQSSGQVVSSEDFTLIESSAGGGNTSEEISAIKAKNTEQDQAISAQDGRITANETKNTEQDTKNTEQDQAISAQDGRITATETKNTEQDTKNTEQDQAISAQDGRITANETQIADLLARIAALESGSGGGGSSTTILNLPEDSPQDSYAYPNPAYRSLQFANLSPPRATPTKSMMLLGSSRSRAPCAAAMRSILALSQLVSTSSSYRTRAAAKCYAATWQ